MENKQNFRSGIPTGKIFTGPVNWRPAYATPDGNHFYARESCLQNGQMWASNSPDRREVEVQRRRRPTTPPSQRERAETPERQQTGGTSGAGGGGTTRPSGSFGLPGGGGAKGIGGIILLLLVVCIYFGIQMLGGGGGDQATEEQTSQQEYTSGEEYNLPGEQAVAAPTRTPRPTPKPAATAVLKATATKSSSAGVVANDKQTWLVMLYQDADDKVLEQDIYLDLNEAEKVGSSDQVKLVAQIDRFRGGYTGDGDWTTTKRFLISTDQNLGRLRSTELDDIGEANMADSKTLVNFVTWAMQTYPSDKYVLILSDHGMGWPGGFSDPTASGSTGSRAALASRIGGDYLYLNEIDAALSQIRAQTGLDKFEMIGMDACLMGQLEVFTALEPHARFAVASEEIEPALGWAYTEFLNALSNNPGMDGGELSKVIVESYIVDDQRIVDDQARADFLRQGSPIGMLFGSISDVPPTQLAAQIGQSSTLTAVDLNKLPDLINRFNNLALTMQTMGQQPIARARNYTQSYTSIFGNEVPPSYLDLGHYLQVLTESSQDEQLSQDARSVLSAINQAVIAEKHGPKKPGSTGITIYFPNSQLYGSSVTGAASYTAIADRFASVSLWDDFLAYHYTGQSFRSSDAIPVVPASGTAIRAPGAGTIDISAIKLSSQTVAPGEYVTMTADISGDNIGYIYLLTGFYDQAANSIMIADQDYLESADTRQVSGVYYPEWGEGDFTLKFDWEPLVFAIDDGVNTVTALFTPRSYGESFEQAVYTVDGIYTFADSGEQQSARLYFINGDLQQVFGFTSNDTTGAPHEITPQPGDTFTVTQTWLDLDSSGNVSQTITKNGGTLTFGDQPFTWVDQYAAAGEYIVGFVVEDLDGNATQSLARITVE